MPTVAFLTILGSFAIHSDVGDMQMMFVLGVIAWVLQRYGFSPSPIVLGLVLGSIAEQGFVQAYMIGNATNGLLGMFFGRPISLAIVAFAALTLGYPLIARLFRRRIEPGPTEATDTVVKADKAVQARHRDVPAILFGVLFAGAGVAAYAQTKNMSTMGSVFPTTIAALLVLLSGALIALQIGRPAAPASVPTPAAGPALAKESTWRRVAIIVAMGIWALLLPSVGFFVTSLVAFLMLIAIATFERPTVREMVVHAIAAVSIVGSFDLLMDKVLGLRMPMGLFF